MPIDAFDKLLESFTSEEPLCKFCADNKTFAVDDYMSNIFRSKNDMLDSVYLTGNMSMILYSDIVPEFTYPGDPLTFISSVGIKQYVPERGIPIKSIVMNMHIPNIPHYSALFDEKYEHRRKLRTGLVEKWYKAFILAMAANYFFTYEACSVMPNPPHSTIHNCCTASLRNFSRNFFRRRPGGRSRSIYQFYSALNQFCTVFHISNPTLYGLVNLMRYTLTETDLEYVICTAAYTDTSYVGVRYKNPVTISGKTHKHILEQLA